MHVLAIIHPKPPAAKKLNRGVPKVKPEKQGIVYRCQPVPVQVPPKPPLQTTTTTDTIIAMPQGQQEQPQPSPQMPNDSKQEITSSVDVQPSSSTSNNKDLFEQDEDLQLHEAPTFGIATSEDINNVTIFGMPEDAPDDEDEENFKQFLADAALEIIPPEKDCLGLMKKNEMDIKKTRKPLWKMIQTGFLQVLKFLFSIFLVHALNIAGKKEVLVHHTEPRNKIYVEVHVDNIPFTALIDTGAESCCMSTELYNKLPGKEEYKNHSTSWDIIDSNQREVKQVSPPKLLPLQIGNVHVTHPVAVIQTPDPTFFVIGMCFLNENDTSILRLNKKVFLKSGDPFGQSPLIPTSSEPIRFESKLITSLDVNSTQLPNNVEAPGLDIPASFDMCGFLENNLHDKEMLQPLLHLFEQYENVIAKHEFDFGKLKLNMKMDIETTAETPVSSKPYFLDNIRACQLEKFLDRMVNHGLLVKGSSNWTSPGFLVPRVSESGGIQKIRLVFDYRKINSITVKDKFPLPLIQHLLSQLHRGVYFSVIDLKSAFFSCLLTDSASHKAAIITPTAIYRPLRVMMGLCNAPNFFARVMQEVLKGVENVVFFQDDILVITREPSKEQHLKDIEAVLKRLGECGMKVNGKGHFFETEVKFLGKLVSGEGMKPLPSHVNTMRGFPPPTTAKEVQRFLGLAAWLSSFISNYAKKIAPFTKLVSLKNFTWSEELDTAFKSLKKEVTVNSFLYFPDFNEPFYLASDICKGSFASILYQVKSYRVDQKEELEKTAGKVNQFPVSKITTAHPVLPGPSKGVPPHFPLQADENASASATHLLAAVNKGEEDLTSLVQSTEIQHVRAVGFHSGVFQGPAEHYSSLEKETVGLILAIEHFAHYLVQAPVTYVVTDCQSLIWLLRLRNLGISKIERMCTKLLSYPFKIIVAHLKGNHLPADLLTRLYHVPGPPKVRLTEAKEARVVRCPFPVGTVIGVEDITLALQENHDLVAIPEPPSKGRTKKFNVMSSLNKMSFSTLSKELQQELSRENLSKAQADDLTLKTIRSRLLLGEDIPGFTLQQGLICKERQSKTGLPPGIIVPKALTTLLFAYYHLDVHSGYKSLAQMIRQDFYVPNLEEQLRKFTAACAMCSAYKANTSPKVATGIAPLPTRKAETWHFDLVTGLPPSEGFDAYLSFLDPFSGFRLGVPCRSNITAQFVTRVIRQYVIMIFGVPTMLVSDAGPQMLKAAELQSFCEFYGIQAKVGVPYSPKSHGRIEISNRYITEAVAILAEQFKVSWTKVMAVAVHRLNCRPRAYFGALSPFNIMFGEHHSQKLSIPPSLQELNPLQQRHLFKTLDAKLTQLIRNAAEDMARQNESLGGIKTYIRPGSLVHLKIFRTRHKKKTQPRFLAAPVTVLHDYGQVLMVKNMVGIVSLVHKSNIKVARERDAQLFRNLPLKVKALLGEPYTFEEISEAIERGDIPKFWEPKPPEKPPGPTTRSKSEQNKPEAGPSLPLPFEEDEDEESEDENEQSTPSPHPPQKTVRFQE